MSVATDDVEVVIPTLGRPSLRALLDALAAQDGGPPPRITLVVDAADADLPAVPDALTGRVRVLAGPGAGPAAARNVGWRAALAGWVAFLDDDVIPDRAWWQGLAEDIAGADPDVAGVQGNLRVPLPPERRPTDWERNVTGLETARWATADLVYRRDVLAEVGGFDERFPRAYREDADLGLRITRAGWRITRGSRWITHPVRPADRWVSVRLQAGNADDVLMRALHGPTWRAEAGIPEGRRPRHLAVAAAGATAALASATGRRRLSALAGLGWLAGTAELAWARIAPGPRDAGEVATMAATSVALPFAASAHWLRGWLRLRRLLRAGGPRPMASAARPSLPGTLPAAVLLDRDGTLIVDVPYNGDPARVEPMPGAASALDRLRAAGVRLALVSNQSGVARGLITHAQVEAVNARVADLLGPFDAIVVCPHGPGDGCTCRKPAPGMLETATAQLGVAPAECVMIGDIGSDVDAGRAAGCRTVLVPTPVTLPAEVAAAPETAATLSLAVDRLLAGAPARRAPAHPASTPSGAPA